MATSSAQSELSELLARLVRLNDSLTAQLRAQLDTARRSSARKELEKILARRERQRERMVESLSRLGARVTEVSDAVAARSPLEASMIGSAGLALEAALLRRVRKLAEEADDRDLVRLARRRRKDSERLLAEAQNQVRRAVASIDDAAGPALDAALSFLTGGGGDGASATARPTSARPSSTRRSTSRRNQSSSRRRPTSRRRTASTSASSNASSSSSGGTSTARPPVANYDKLASADVLKRISSGTPAQAKKIATYERAHKGRKTILQRADAKAKK